MSLTLPVGARRAGSVLAAIGALLAMLLVATPAQAAPVVNLSADASSIALGESVTLSWTAADSTTLDAEGAWTGSKQVPEGSEVVTPTEAGTFTYTLVAGNGEDADSSDSVVVTVAPGPITPEPVTFPDACTVVVPTTPNVTYVVDFGDGDVEEVEAGTYDGIQFSFGEEVTFRALADDGFELAEGAVTSWVYTAPDSCFVNATLVEATAVCGEVTFENVTAGTVAVLYGDEDEDQPDGELALESGQSRTVDTTREELVFVASATGQDAGLQFGVLEVPQNCGGDDESGDGDESGNGDGGSDHPTVAPAAGIAAR